MDHRSVIIGDSTTDIAAAARRSADAAELMAKAAADSTAASKWVMRLTFVLAAAAVAEILIAIFDQPDPIVLSYPVPVPVHHWSPAETPSPDTPAGDRLHHAAPAPSPD